MERIRRAMQRLFIAGITTMLAIAPMTAHAAGTPTLDSLWNQPQGVSMDSAFYVFQAWWDGYRNTVSNDPTQRGFDELTRANADLLNAYTLLQHAHAGGAQPVAIVDPLLASAYDAVTGSNLKAPVGEVFASINRGLLSAEGRQSSSDQVSALLQDYRALQAAGIRDLQSSGTTAYVGLIASNAQREADFLTQVQGVSTPDDGLTSLLADAVLQTTTVAHRQSLTALARGSHGQGNGVGHANAGGNGLRNGHGHDPRKGTGDSQVSGKK